MKCKPNGSCHIVHVIVHFATASIDDAFFFTMIVLKTGGNAAEMAPKLEWKKSVWLPLTVPLLPAIFKTSCVKDTRPHGSLS